MFSIWVGKQQMQSLHGLTMWGFAAKIESDSEEDEDDFLPQRKLQKKPSGPRAAGEQQPPRARPASGGSGATTASGDRPAAKPRPTQKVASAHSIDQSINQSIDQSNHQ